MQGSPLRMLAVVAIVGVTIVLVAHIAFGGPDPKAGRCVDAHNGLVGCGSAAAVFRLVREVDSDRECPEDSLKLYEFRSKLFCGVALKGAPAPSDEYVPCLLLAGAQLAGSAADLRFAARDVASARRSGVGGARTGAVALAGDDWRIFYVLSQGQLDPGPRAIVADPAKAPFVAYIADASAHAKEVAAAARCSPRAAAATP
jgi:hypothetical protein